MTRSDGYRTIRWCSTVEAGPMAVDDTEVVEWLLEGDPAIRWQVMRDLLDEPEEVWEDERARTLTEGWVAEMLSRRNADDEWPAGRWTASTWTLLLLVALGVPEREPAGRPAIERLLDRFMPPDEEVDGGFLLRRVDLCHLAFWLGLATYYVDQDDPRPTPLAEAILSVQFEDGGWNCHMRNHPHRTHSSFHTTLNVLENVRIAAGHGVVPHKTFRVAEARAAELLLSHRMQLTYPWHWHYTYLRGLDYLRLTPEIGDERLDDPIELLQSQRKPNGRWPLHKRIPGTPLVQMHARREAPCPDELFDAVPGKSRFDVGVSRDRLRDVGVAARRIT